MPWMEKCQQGPRQSIFVLSIHLSMLIGELPNYFSEKDYSQEIYPYLVFLIVDM